MGVFSSTGGSAPSSLHERPDALPPVADRSARRPPPLRGRSRGPVRKAYGGSRRGSSGPRGFGRVSRLARVPGAEDEVCAAQILDSRMVEAFDSLERTSRARHHPRPARPSSVSRGPPRPRRPPAVLRGSWSPPTSRRLSCRWWRRRIGPTWSITARDAGGLRATSRRRTRVRSRRPDAPSTAAGDWQPGHRGAPTQEDDERSHASSSATRTPCASPRSGLGRLAEQTGGFLIQATNDLSSARGDGRRAGRVLHALLRAEEPGYGPSAHRGQAQAPARGSSPEGLPGHQTALPAPPSTTKPRPSPARGRPLPSAVPLSPPGPAVPREPPVSVVRSWSRCRAAASRTDHRRLVRDASRSVVAKMSQRYALSDRGIARGGGPGAVPSRDHLPPGSYSWRPSPTTPTGAAGAITSTLEVPAVVADHLRASSRWSWGARKSSAPARRGAEPAQYGDVLLRPNLPAAPHRRAGRSLLRDRLAVLRAARGGRRVEVLHDGQTVAATAATRLRPDAGGRIPAREQPFPRAFRPGAYELR